LLLFLFVVIVAAAAAICYYCMFLCLWSLLGNVDDCSDDSTIYLNNPDVARCPKTSWLALALFFIYILISSIMLINLLIAIFTFVFTKHFKYALLMDKSF